MNHTAAGFSAKTKRETIMAVCCTGEIAKFTFLFSSASTAPHLSLLSTLLASANDEKSYLQV